MGSTSWRPAPHRYRERRERDGERVERLLVSAAGDDEARDERYAPEREKETEKLISIHATSKSNLRANTIVGQLSSIVTRA